MTTKQIEQKLLEYIDLQETYDHKENALKEFDKIREKFLLDDLIHIGFIVNDYPDFDHLLLKVDGNGFFLKFGLSREYLKSLSKKDLHKLARGLHGLFGKFKLKE